MSQIDLDSKLDYREEYSKYLKNIKVQGNELLANCPVHKNGNEKKQSFCVNIPTGMYHCFTCGIKGNYVDFVAMQYNIPTKEAAKRIYEAHNLMAQRETKVENNYTVEQYANEKKISAEWLKAEWGLKDTKTSITIPYYNEKKEIVRSRLRGAGKKFRWGKGNSTLLYGLHKFQEIKEKGYVVIVEGESDTQTLWLNDIPALGSPGATNFNSAWNDLLHNIPEIYIHQENDFGGEEFVRHVCRSLCEHNYKGKVYKIQCSIKQQKDPSDLYRSNPSGFKENWNSVFKAKTEINVLVFNETVEEQVPGMPIKLRPVDGWKLNQDGIYQMNSKTGEFIRFCRTPVILLNRLKSSLSQEEKIEIAFYRDEKWETAIYPRSTIFQARSITQLADIGITVTSENSKALVKFLQCVEENNIDLLKVKNTVNRLGWHGKYFVPFFNGDYVLDIDRNMYKWAEGYKSKGTLEKWVEIMIDYRKNKVFRFNQNISFASPLLRKLGLRNFVSHNYAETRSGKTACMMAGNSVWGDPQKNLLNFNATQVGLERTAAFYSDLPLPIDEKQLQGNRNGFLETIIYMLGNGTSKIRGNKDGGIQNQSHWNSIIITTGEEPMIRNNSLGGITSRVLEIEGKPFDTEEMASKMYTLAEENYGLAGPRFIEKLLEEFKENFSPLKKKYNEYIEKLISEVKGKSRAYAGYISLEIITDELVNKYIFNKETINESYLLGKEIYSNLPNERDTDLIEKFYEFADSWVMSNHYNFDVIYENSSEPSSQGNSKERYGVFEDNVEKMKRKARFFDPNEMPERVYYILPNVFQNVLLPAFNKDGHDLNYRDIIKKLAAKGYIQTEGNRNQVRIKYHNTYIRAIAFIPGIKTQKEQQEDNMEIATKELKELYSDLQIIE